MFIYYKSPSTVLDVPLFGQENQKKETLFKKSFEEIFNDHTILVISATEGSLLLNYRFKVIQEKFNEFRQLINSSNQENLPFLILRKNKVRDEIVKNIKEVSLRITDIARSKILKEFPYCSDYISMFDIFVAKALQPVYDRFISI